MRRIERPLDHEAVQSADEQIYAAHEDDPRPNALFDAEGNRQQLSSTDPSQEALRQEWREDYFVALDARKGGTADDNTDDNSTSSSYDSTDVPASSSTSGDTCPADPVLSCEEMHWITIQLKPFKNSEKRPNYWPAPPADDAFAFESYAAELTIGHAEDYLDAGGSTTYPRIPAGTCQIKFSFAFKNLQQYFDRLVRGQGED